VQTHEDQNPGIPAPQLWPNIPGCGAGWIRDNLTWQESETSAGVYSLPSKVTAYLNLAHSLGLKVDLNVLGPGPSFYNPYDQTHFAAWIGWVAGQMVNYPACAAIEILNEPNNNYAPYISGSWWQPYVNLLNASYTAIKNANSNMIVIGLGGNPSDNDAMLAMNPSLDGVTDHPYMGDPVENGFAARVADLRSRTTKPLWFTEWGKSTQYGPNNAWHETEGEQAVECARQLLQTYMLGVEHNFLYEFEDDAVNPTDNGSNFGIWSGAFGAGNGYNAWGGFPKQLYYVLGTIEGYTANPTQTEQVNQADFGTYNQSPGFDASHFFLYGLRTPQGDVLPFWFGTHSWQYNTGTINIWWYHPGFSSVTLVDPISGKSTPASWTYGGDHNSVIINVTVSQSPQMIIVH
jgi:hypothetical protein